MSNLKMSLQEQKWFARNYRGDEVDKMIRAIDKLCDVIKKLRFRIK